MGIEEALCAADICISDYSSLIFEYSLFERPMLFYAYDYDTYGKYRGTYYDYESFIPGKMVRTEEELMDAVVNMDSWFDKTQVREFKEKYMRFCDGHSTKRVAAACFN
jgi:CDP-glycerol glycerophosphotransferase (TagB/SpsB family)